MIDLFASAPQYAAHLTPIFDALSAQGLSDRSYGSRSHHEWATARLPRPAQQRGVQAVMVASYVDYERTYPAPVVYVEHGAGQTYEADPLSAANPSYAGGPGFERVVLFVCPSEHVAERWRQAYPSIPAVAVGCAKLDPWHSAMFHVVTQPGGSSPASEPISTRSPAATSAVGRATEHLGDAASATTPSWLLAPTSEGTRAIGAADAVAVTFHWDCPLCPETLSAWRHYDRHLPLLAQWARAEGVELLGHGHPRMWRKLAERWRRLGVEPVEQFDDVLDRAGLLIFDNSSAGFEFASCDRPVVVLNAPWYRRDVDHGGRFWRWADVGVQCDEPADLIAAVERALVDAPEQRESRQRVVSEVYAACDGMAAQRAADEIAKVLDGDTIRQRQHPSLRGF